MMEIPLTIGMVAIVDDHDYDLVFRHKWYAAKQRNTYYAARTIKVDGRKKTIWMHRVINLTPEGYITDHIDGNGLNNRRDNLRSITHQSNMINNRRHKIGSPKHRGVSWHKRNKCWIAQITVNNRNIWLGSFRTELEAKIAYDKKRAQVRIGQVYVED